MNRANIAMLELAAEGLGDLLDELVFVGGATVELWITDPGAPEFRPTYDVDALAPTSAQSCSRWSPPFRSLPSKIDWPTTQTTSK